MSTENNRKSLLLLRIVLLVTIIIIIQSAVPFLFDSFLIGNPIWFVVFVFTGLAVFILIAMIIFAQIPTYTEEETVDFFIGELQDQEKVYVIPTICPHCKTSIKLDSVLWKDEHTLLCQECQRKLKLRVVEK